MTKTTSDFEKKNLTKKTNFLWGGLKLRFSANQKMVNHLKFLEKRCKTWMLHCSEPNFVLNEWWFCSMEWKSWCRYIISSTPHIEEKGKIDEILIGQLFRPWSVLDHNFCIVEAAKATLMLSEFFVWIIGQLFDPQKYFYYRRF